MWEVLKAKLWLNPKVNINEAIGHKPGMHGCDEGFSLHHYFLCIVHFNRVTFVVGNQADFLSALLQTPQLFRDRPVFDEVFTKCIDEATVRLANVGSYRRARSQ